MTRRLEILVLGLAAVLAALAVRSQVSDVPSWLLPVDDAYIFIRYAQQAADGMPLQWNSGEPSTGATNLAFAALLVPGQWLFDDLVGWSYASIFVGLLCLAALGLAAASLVRALLSKAIDASRRRVWALAAGLAVIGGGPFAYFSVGGMDNAFSAAMLLGALARIVSSGGRKGLLWIACLPWVRPDYAVVVGVVALWRLAHDRAAWPRRLARSALLFAPGLLLMAMNLVLTEHASPGGALAKSVFSDPFQTPAAALVVLWRQLTETLLPVYVGLKPTILPPPVGLLAVAVVSWVLILAIRRTGGDEAVDAAPDAPPDESADEARRLLLPVLVWLALASVAITSGYLWWQRLRHHHPALALAWVLAFVGVATWLRRRRLAPHAAVVLCLGLLPWIGLVEVSRDYADSARSFYTHNFRTAAWLQQHLSESFGESSGEPRAVPVVATHDAGLYSLVGESLDLDLALVDLMGLGTTDLALPYRDGIGALVEHLARRSPLPTLAVGRKSLLRLGPLLGPELFSSVPGSPESMVVASIAAERLRETTLSDPGVDFGYLPSEARVELRWDPPPPTASASLGAIVRQPGFATVQGCRPLPGRLEVNLRGLEDDGATLRVMFTLVRETGSGPPVPALLSATAAGESRSAQASAGQPGILELPWAPEMRLERGTEGAGGMPCLESIAVVD